MKRPFLIFLGFLSVSPFAFSAPSWDLNDVTYLLPLPSPQNIEGCLKSMDIGGDGAALLPKEFLNGASNLAFGDILLRSPSFNAYDDLFVMGVRIDPCFRDEFSRPCRKQIRMTWQPVDRWREAKAVTLDVTFHTFYDFDDNTFLVLLKDLQDLKRRLIINTKHFPLGVHPGFSIKELTMFQREFKEIVLHYAISSRITRVAAITLASNSIGWDLFSDDIDANQVRKPIKIFPGAHTAQFVANPGGLDPSIFSSPEFDSRRLMDMKNYLSSTNIHLQAHAVCKFVGVDNQPETSDQLFRFLENSQSALANAKTAKIYLTRAARIENPAIHLPGTMDCLSCHTANMTKILSSKALGVASPQPSFRGRMNLKNISRYYGDTHNLRMLGYVDSEIQIGDRVIYESAAVADFLNQNH